VLGALETVLWTCETVDWTMFPEPPPEPDEPDEPLEPLPLDPAGCDEPDAVVAETVGAGVGLEATGAGV
jgi:hypothetical protein